MAVGAALLMDVLQTIWVTNALQMLLGYIWSLQHDISSEVDKTLTWCPPTSWPPESLHMISCTWHDCLPLSIRKESVPDVHQPPRNPTHWPAEERIHTSGSHTEERRGPGRGRVHQQDVLVWSISSKNIQVHTNIFLHSYL